MNDMQTNSTPARPLARVEAWLSAHPRWAEAAAILLITLLWSLFFWRHMTPNPANQVSFEEGDFSGQFYAFAHYQAVRLRAGEVPLWNPYNYAGHPFLADVQTAVFYPPRLISIFASAAVPPYGWTYAALQLEAVAHYWLAAVLMYAFARTLTGNRLAGLVSALTLTFGGYLTGYPALQLAILEAGIWLPLSLLGVLKGFSDEGRIRPAWLALASLGLALALLAGHPQTGLHYTYLLIAFFVHRAVKSGAHRGWAVVALALVLIGGYGLAAIQLLPAGEYLRYTTRAGITFDELANGFPFSDLMQMVWPNILTSWSPLYAGVAPLALAILAVWRGQSGARFWGIVGLVALGLSLGGNTLFYSLAYLLAPGFALFRGQERAAFGVAYAVSVLAGLGTVTLVKWTIEEYMDGRRFQRWLRGAVALAWFVAVCMMMLSRVAEKPRFPVWFAQSVLTALIVTLTWAIFTLRWRDFSAKLWQIGLVALVVFDLFTNTAASNVQLFPPAQQFASTLHGNYLIGTTIKQHSDYRLDGRLVLGWNYGTLLDLEDIYGVSPLILDPVSKYLDDIPQFRRHELLSVELVLTDWSELEVDSEIIAEAEDPYGPFYLHRLDNPRPRALLMYDFIVSDDTDAIAFVRDLGSDPRHTIVLDRNPSISLPDEPPDDPGKATITRRKPERIVIETDAPQAAILSLSEVYYPGWQATLDGNPTEILKAYGGLRAIVVPAGEHTIEMTYRPMSFRIGLVISAASAVGLLAVALSGLLRKRRMSPNA